MTGYILSLIILVLGIADSKYLLMKIHQPKNYVNTSKHSKSGYRQMQIVPGHLPIGINNGIFNRPKTNVLPFGPIPNLPIPSPNPDFPHNPYLQVVAGKLSEGIVSINI